MKKWALSVLLPLLVPSPSPAQKSLHWRSLDVVARLDSDGALHVRERQAMVFTGDWNGGERTFRLAWDHELELIGIEREDLETHARTPLSPGDLSRVDEYDWVDSNRLRWRSRLPSDPPFQSREIVYVLEYTLESILVPGDDGTYLLDHDFAFPEREGDILAFSLELSFDPVWSPLQALAGEIRRGRLPPGESVVVTIPLEYSGKDAATAVRFGASLASRAILGLALLLGVATIGLLFYREERALGRFEPLTPREEIDGAWLEENVFSMLPEEVGAAWDETTGAPEVAAVLARMVSEKKLESEVQGRRKWLGSESILRLRLLVDRERLSGYEKSLVKALFVSGNETDTEIIRKHYEKRGFDPTTRIQGPLARRVKTLLGGSPHRIISKKPALGLLAASVVLLAIGFGEALSVVAAFGVAALAYVFGILAAGESRKRFDRPLLFTSFFLAPAAVIVASALFFLAFNPFRSGSHSLAAVVLFDLALVTSLLNMAKLRSAPSAIELKKKLASARRYFAFELERPQPRLKDEWFPYLLAFELGPDVDRWFVVHGGSTDDGRTDTGVSSSSGGGGGPRPWTGGGGAFGGAGATGSWASAVGSVTAGVSAPSEGGSSGGGGGGSSGGGGGGGW